MSFFSLGPSHIILCTVVVESFGQVTQTACILSNYAMSHADNNAFFELLDTQNFKKTVSKCWRVCAEKAVYAC